MIENNPKEKSRAYAVIHDDEGYDWSQIPPEEDRIDNQVTAHGRTTSKSKHHVFVAEIKEKTREEILREKTERERFIVGCRMEKMQEEYENVIRNKRWDKNRECYVNRDGEPVVPRRDIVHDDVLLVIPLSDEYYSNAAKDKTYPKRLDKIIRHAMTSSLRKRDEERMKKNVEKLVDDLKKMAKEVKIEAVKVKDEKIEEEKVIKEVVEEKAVTEEQQVGQEEMMKKEEEEEEEVKKESLVAGDDGDEAVGEEENKKDADQTETTNNTEVTITEVKSDSEVLIETVEQLKYCSETSDTLKRQYSVKQQVVNSYIEDVAKLKRQIADFEQDNNKLHSYRASSYVLERIFNIKPGDDDSEKNKKGIGSEYHQVPPPKKLAFYDDEKVLLKKTECQPKENRSSLAREEEAAGPCDG
ncbi:golgin subfamily A member 6-like protein 6 [Helianthus annuus]|uniref:golgin subfamily A member 6-like protein 6 n=1 Tax=Helianthus annuus TaxID=4232 RepID=UPI00165335CC|nr:golgin subfamily A member 6-like protein 6 [Helianthus annuus]